MALRSTITAFAISIIGAAAMAETVHVRFVDGRTRTFDGVADVFTRPIEDGGATVVSFTDGREPVRLFGTFSLTVEPATALDAEPTAD